MTDAKSTPAGQPSVQKGGWKAGQPIIRIAEAGESEDSERPKSRISSGGRSAADVRIDAEPF